MSNQSSLFVFGLARKLIVLLMGCAMISGFSSAAAQSLSPEDAPENDNPPLATARNSLSDVFPDKRPALQPGFRNPEDLWLLYSPDFDLLSGNLQSRFLRKYGILEVSALSPGGAEKVNNPTLDLFERMQSETSSATAGRNIVVAYNDILQPVGASLSISNDAGRTWKQVLPPVPPLGGCFGDPVVAAGPGGVFYFAQLGVNALGSSMAAVTKSTDGGTTWSPVSNATASRTNPSEQVDKEWIAVDNTASPFRGNVYVSWSRFTFAFGERNGIGFVRSTDGGKTWSDFQLVGEPADSTGGVQGSMIAVGPSGEVYVAYYDSRLPGIAVVKSTDGGLNFGPAVIALQDTSLRARILSGGFDLPPFPSLAVDGSGGPGRGTVYITTQIKPSNPRDDSDVVLVKSTDGGATWSLPARVHSDTTDTDQFMPSAAVAPDGTLGLAWLDRRNDPANNVLLDVYMTTSRDGGATFTSNRRVTSANWMLVPTPLTFRTHYHGDYNQISAGEIGFVVNWSDDRSGTDSDIEVAVLSTAEAQNPSPDFILSSATPARNTLAGSSASFTINLLASGGFDGAVRLEGAPANTGWRYGFSASESRPTSEVTLRLDTPANTPPGTYPITITGRAGALERSTTLRLTVYNPAEIRRAPSAVSGIREILFQPRAVADSQGNLHVVYGADPRRGASSFGALNYARYRGGAPIAAGAVMRVGAPNVSATNHAIGVDESGNITVIWRQVDPDTIVANIFMSRSVDAGATFSEPASVSGNTDRRTSVSSPSLAVSRAGVISVAYFKSDSVSQIIALTRSSDGGATFSDVVNAATVSSFPSSPILVADQGEGLGIAFLASARFGRDLFVARSNDGSSFSPPVNISLTNSANPSAAVVASPSIAIDSSGTIYVAYIRVDRSRNEQDIYFASSTDGGASFSSPVNASSTTAAGMIAYGPSVGTDSAGNVGIAMGAFLAGTLYPAGRDVLFSRSTDGGQTFSPVANLSNDIGLQSTFPALLADENGQFTVLWEDETGGNNQIVLVTP
ncbi:MAG: hypothetical protein HY315_02950 [Acidobacteria bacterium]|nr:hypothetical protein [Acidobacteriota bacterium]